MNKMIDSAEKCLFIFYVACPDRGEGLIVDGRKREKNGMAFILFLRHQSSTYIAFI